MAYTEPTAADLKTRYAAFAEVDNAVIAYWLVDAHRFVDTSWFEGDYAPALIAHAAHRMTEEGVAGIAGSDISEIAGSGVTSFKSGTFAATFSEAAATQAAEGGYASTRFGREYYALLRKNKGGVRVSGPCP